ncbi:hypothetical protein [Streptomyces lavendulocolor]|uniref:hypothetical protein n=1 Tax=Streptomyces lavendulocolor TaxID=67316 RepID=UPI003405E3B3
MVQEPFDAGVVGQPQSPEFALVTVAGLTAVPDGEQDAVVGPGRFVGVAADQQISRPVTPRP